VGVRTGTAQLLLWSNYIHWVWGATFLVTWRRKRSYFETNRK